MNKLKFKRIIIVASFIIIMMTSILKYPSSFASSNANLYLVFDKTTYNVGDIVNININLDQFASLSEVKLQIKIKEEYFSQHTGRGSWSEFIIRICDPVKSRL